MEEIKKYSKFVIEEMQGRLTISLENIKKGCLADSGKEVNKIHSEKGVFVTKEEALEAFKEYHSSYTSYSRSVHHVTEYELMEVVYEADEEDGGEYPVDFKRIALSEFEHYQLWIVQADGTLRFSHIITLDDVTPFKIPYRNDDIGAVWTNLDNKVIKEFQRNFSDDDCKKEDWLKNLKAGDKVVVCVTKYCNIDLNVATIEKVTKKHIYVGKRVFNLDGRQCRYDTAKLLMPTETTLKAVRIAKMKAKTKALLKDVIDNFILLDYEQMNAICDIVENKKHSISQN